MEVILIIGIIVIGLFVYYRNSKVVVETKQPPLVKLGPEPVDEAPTPTVVSQPVVEQPVVEVVGDQPEMSQPKKRTRKPAAMKASVKPTAKKTTKKTK